MQNGQATMRLRDYSIKTKLNVLLVVAAGVSLGISVVAFVANDIRIMRAAKVSQLAAVADLLGSHCQGALETHDAATLRDVLTGFKLQPTVTYACVYNAGGHPLAEYGARSQVGSRSPPLNQPGHRFRTGKTLDWLGPIQRDGRMLGSIYIHATTEDLLLQLHNYLPIVALILILSLTTSLLLSTRLRRFISEPILRLASTAQRISASGDYSLRVRRAAGDELGTLYGEFNGMLDRIEQSERQLQEAHTLLERRVADRTAQLTQANFDLTREIADRESAECELAKMHEQLIEAARRAGMAEIATGVLHNVGNVLNSVNVSCTLVAERLRKAKIADLERTVQLLRAHRNGLGEFLVDDEQGRQVLGFLDLLSRHLDGEQRFLLSEVHSLIKNIDHIKSIVVMQQSYAGVSGVIAPVALSELLNQAVTLNESTCERRGIDIQREFAALPEILTDHQKVLQIVVNLLQNARDALVDSGAAHPQIRLRLELADERSVRIEVADNGPGIAAENLSRIFSHGFTTKQAGHGFGLHSCANAARELGGSLLAYSLGLGRGATFVLELPYQPAEVTV